MDFVQDVPFGVCHQTDDGRGVQGLSGQRGNGLRGGAAGSCKKSRKLLSSARARQLGSRGENLEVLLPSSRKTSAAVPLPEADGHCLPDSAAETTRSGEEGLGLTAFLKALHKHLQNNLARQVGTPPPGKQALLPGMQ